MLTEVIRKSFPFNMDANIRYLFLYGFLFLQNTFSHNSFMVLKCHVIIEIDIDVLKIQSNHVSNIFQCHIL